MGTQPSVSNAPQKPLVIALEVHGTHVRDLYPQFVKEIHTSPTFLSTVAPTPAAVVQYALNEKSFLDLVPQLKEIDPKNYRLTGTTLRKDRYSSLLFPLFPEDSLRNAVQIHGSYLSVYLDLNPSPDDQEMCHNGVEVDEETSSLPSSPLSGPFHIKPCSLSGKIARRARTPGSSLHSVDLSPVISPYYSGHINRCRKDLHTTERDVSWRSGASSACISVSSADLKSSSRSEDGQMDSFENNVKYSDRRSSLTPSHRTGNGSSLDKLYSESLIDVNDLDQRRNGGAENSMVFSFSGTTKRRNSNETLKPSETKERGDMKDNGNIEAAAAVSRLKALGFASNAPHYTPSMTEFQWKTHVQQSMLGGLLGSLAAEHRLRFPCSCEQQVKSLFETLSGLLALLRDLHFPVPLYEHIPRAIFEVMEENDPRHMHCRSDNLSSYSPEVHASFRRHFTALNNHVFFDAKELSFSFREALGGFPKMSALKVRRLGGMLWLNSKLRADVLQLLEGLKVWFGSSASRVRRSARAENKQTTSMDVETFSEKKRKRTPSLKVRADDDDETLEERPLKRSCS